MIYTLCQRLIDNPRIGFDYDYMGHAEYEFGATRDARHHLNDASLLSRAKGVVKTDSVFGGIKAHHCVFVFSRADEPEAESMMEALASGKYRNKGVMAYDTRQPLGWLILSPVPALVHMDDEDGAERAQKFLDHAKELFADA